MIVLNAEPSGYSEKAIKRWQEKGYQYKASGWDEIAKQDCFDDVQVLIVRLAKKIDQTVLNKFPFLTHLVTATTGLDHIDIPSLEKKQVRLVSLKDHPAFLQTIPSTAEHTWALLLALIRNIPAANEHVKSGKWDRDKFRGYQLKGKTIGIIGLGRTGGKLASYATAFDMKVQYFDPNVEGQPFLKKEKLEDLLADSDIISLHVHLKEDTHKLIGEQNITYIKEGALLLNTSRGNVWDEAAICKLLFSKKIGGIATDVLSTELVDIKQSPLWQAQQQNENVIITPHLGGATWDAMWSCEEFIVDQI